MPKPAVIAWLERKDYAAFKAQAPADPDLPETYEEWLERAEDQSLAFAKSGIGVERVTIKPEELTAYCDECRINPDGAARSALAVQKVCLRNRGKPG